MALVDYSSSTSSSDAEQERDQEPPAKRRKNGSAASSTAVEAAMPPLPAAFHDLYASTVRQSVVDDPSLHQGRKRQNPHVPGNWPTHVYVEWHPGPDQHELLEELVGRVEDMLDEGVALHNFLTSDLGAPLPLHISLSRPLSLPTADKDPFLERLTRSLRTSGTEPFAVRPSGLAWYKSPDSERTFLILRVEARKHGANPELMALLTRCNTVSALFKQPALYQVHHSEAADSAFHVSIGWTFGLPDEETSLRVLRLFREKRFRAMHAWEIAVPGVKAKIGNVVTHVALGGGGGRSVAGGRDAQDEP
ncbi:poly(U)-specific 3'-to-5' RNA exonuclease [Purpureocillium takamizusanense]|uniref:U6 snRNA phosphodiesterase n=1 Tax=Purpureocillium takamizusanense TaxID=2060973 RepID=A0A9Q8QMZ0_9HYPO|nr:poly(U)-specific 3'-to-5' RNA exonuclease [Purpureocillium takamizusanense]UNI23083.1 poly(U)-specific 3'-to-5' RNA exonuclease [Purpureocillium takamizusanense]